MNNEYIIFASWEDRFLESLKNDISLETCDHVTIFYCKEFLGVINKTLSDALVFLQCVNISYKKIEVSFEDAQESWKVIKDTVQCLAPTINKVSLNITTMPRNMIFLLLSFLKNKEIETIYYPAESHGADLTTNPSEPQMVLQHSGISFPDLSTILVVFVGFDVKRVYQLYHYFEPLKIIILFETDDEAKIDKDLELERQFNDIGNKEIYNVSSFENGKMESFFEENITGLIDEHNVLICSLGPKLSAMEVFNYNVKHPETAIVYAPSKNYSEDYSYGIQLDKRHTRVLNYSDKTD